MWVEVRVCRERGERLARARWSEPVRGRLFVGVESRGGQYVRVAELYIESPQWRRSVLQCIFDTEMETWERGFLLKGYQIEAEEGGKKVCEHRQIWYCVPVASAAAAS